MPDGLVEAALHEIAHARAGDKGDRVNISVIAYHPDAYPVIAEQITEARMAQVFGHRRIGRVVRYDLPRLWAFNFVLDGVLEGGVNGSLNLDGHGKSLSFRALSMPVSMPAEVLKKCRDSRTRPAQTGG